MRQYISDQFNQQQYKFSNNSKNEDEKISPNKNLQQIQKDIDNEHQQQTKSNVFYATINLFKGLVGIGILTLPVAFKKSGWLAGLIILPICGLAMLFLSKQMMDVADKYNSKAKNITEFCQEMLGKRSISYVNFCLFGIQIGVCISYVIFFTTYFQKGFCQVLGDQNYSCMSRIPSLLIALGILIPCMFIRHLEQLKKWSITANIFILFSLVVISFYCGLRLNSEGQPKISKLNLSTVSDSVGIFIFTFEGVGLYFDVRHSMQEPKKFVLILYYVISFALFLYTSFGLLGYVTFGDEIKDIILFNFELKVPVIFVVQMLYCVSLILSYPIQIFPCINLIEHMILKKICAKSMVQLDLERERRLSVSNQLQMSVIDEKKIPNTVGSTKRNEPQQSVNKIIEEENKKEEQRYRERRQSYTSFLQEEDVLENEDQNQLGESLLNEEDQKLFLLYSYLVRLCFLIFVFTMALTIDKISIFISLIGSICGTALCYFFPVIIVHKHDPQMPLWRSFINWTIFLVSFVCGCIGAYSSVIRFIKDFEKNV